MSGHVELVLAAMLAGLSVQALAEEACPPDRIIYRGEKHHFVFKADRYGTIDEFSCMSPTAHFFSKTDKSVINEEDLDKSTICKPVGMTATRGTLNGKRVYVVYRIIDGSPCCGWSSYGAIDGAKSTHAIHWQMPGRAKWGELDGGQDGFDTLQDGFFWDSHGPLGGDTYTPWKCAPAKVAPVMAKRRRPS
ncbi:hypothetical protein [Labrys monachus]|uniref:Uncharacterized protein n=1 Tax=Labrys monachus TaxID=217067 RepID=A0ABU0FIX0_9HYPH|nr:hypothetical protein [Labrys monachus]MDQ0394277.1 hypothetical protein [Labrys monachus]